MRWPRKRKADLKHSYAALLRAVAMHKNPALTLAQARRGFRRSFKREPCVLTISGPRGAVNLRIRGDE